MLIDVRRFSLIGMDFSSILVGPHQLSLNVMGFLRSSGISVDPLCFSWILVSLYSFSEMFTASRGFSLSLVDFP